MVALGLVRILRGPGNADRVMAAQLLGTGGIAVVNQNDFNKALKRIDAETSDYYVIGYYSSNPDPMRRTRRRSRNRRRAP